MKTPTTTLMLVFALGATGVLHPGDANAQKPAKATAAAPFPPHHNAAFPGEAKQSVKESKTPSGQTVATHVRELKAGGRYYGTAWTAVPEAPSSPDERAKLLEFAASQALKTEPGATLVSKENVSITGIPGLAYVIDLPKSNTRMRQQIFIVSGVLVQQTYSGPPGTESRREANRFFDSLRLIP